MGVDIEQLLLPPTLNSSNLLDGVVIRAAQHSTGFINRHTRAAAGIISVLLAGFAAAAFGLAPLGPDAADLPRRVISESVAPVGLDAQLDALAAHPLTLFRSDLTRAGDTADTLLRRLGVSDADAAAFLRSDALGRTVLSGRSGKMVQVRAGADGVLEELVARFPADDAQQASTHFTRLRISRHNERLSAHVEQAALQPQTRMGSGTIRNSLFAATDEARLPDPVASQLSDIFSADIDFHRALRRGDAFSVLYETLTADGEPIAWGQASGRVVAAEFINNGKSHSAVWFNGSGDSKGAYYDFNGRSKKSSFLASPLEFSRVTSGFSMRFHPILQSWRQHAGVDYGAPSGTPVRAIGDGVVEFAGQQNGYGNVIMVKHGADQSTVYAHLSRIDVRRGQRVEQGSRIGAVGATGWATGPHLHFEFRLKGVQIDPLQLAQSAVNLPLQGGARQRFAELSRSVHSQLDSAVAAGRGGTAVD